MGSREGERGRTMSEMTVSFITFVAGMLLGGYGESDSVKGLACVCSGTRRGGRGAVWEMREGIFVVRWVSGAGVIRPGGGGGQARQGEAA